MEIVGGLSSRVRRGRLFRNRVPCKFGGSKTCRPHPPLTQTISGAPSDIVLPEQYTLTVGGKTYKGPMVLRNISTILGTDQFQFQATVSLSQWQRTVCRGEPLRIYSMNVDTTFVPGQPSCDSIYENYCLSNGYDTVECSCYREQDELNEKYPGLVVPAPCFGEYCKTSAAYKDQVMRFERVSIGIFVRILLRTLRHPSPTT